MPPDRDVLPDQRACADCGATDDLYYHDRDEVWVCQEVSECVWKRMEDAKEDASTLRAENERLREANEALQAINKQNGAVLLERLLTDRGWTRTEGGNWRAPESPRAIDEPDAPAPRYEIVKMFSGMWNVREANSKEWHKPGVGLSKMAAQTMADDLNSSLPSRDQGDTK